MTNLERRFEEIKNSRRNGHVGFDELCKVRVVEKHGRRTYDTKYAQVMDVDGYKVYCVINNAEPTGSCIVYDAKAEKVIEFTTYKKMRDAYKVRHANELREKALAKVEKLRAELAKAEAELAKFERV